MKTILRVLSSFVSVRIAYAHCDIPCGIYDPYQAQLAAHTVIRMTDLILQTKEEESEEENDDPQERVFIHQLARLTRVKEDHAEIVKHEIRVLWADYFKPEHVKANPNLHEVVFKTMKLASKARQEINMDAAKDLLESVQKIAEIFWKTKNVKTARIPAPSPSGGEIVVPTV